MTFSFSARNVRSLVHEVKTDKKSQTMEKQVRGFKLHMTYGMLTLPLEVCRVFYLAMS